MIKLLLTLVLIPCFIFGEIIETKNFKEITRYITPPTLVILDIDDTLLIPAQTLGSDVWFLDRVQQHKNTGLAAEKAFEKSLAEWEGIRHLTEVKLVEEETDTIIQSLQKDHVTIMGLTTQGLSLATRTVQQLQSLNIDLSKTCPSSEDHYFQNGLGILYRSGILFTSGTNKGKALFKLLGLINYRPKHILFINDKATHLKDIEATASQEGIPFTGLRYAYSDERVQNFDKEIAEIQWNNSTFAHILSDQEAIEMKKCRELIPAL